VKSRLELDRSDELEFIASHFYEVDQSSFEDFSIEWLEEILMDDSLRMESEDWLLDYLISHGSLGHRLLCHVRYEQLSVSGICKFLSNISVSDITFQLWDNVCYRFRHRILPESTNSYRNREIGRFFEASTPW
jgi:hypothetical protein